MITVVFVSNFLSSHQEPFCEEMYNNSQAEFYFIAATPLSEGRKAMGWKEEKEKEYEIRSYLNDDEKNRAYKLIRECDVLLLGIDKIDFLKERMKTAKGITIKVSERIYKNGRWRAISPKGIKNRWESYFKYINKRIYMLCASAYAASDYAMLGSYLGKCYKWGYFPPVKNYDIKKLLCSKNENEILWVGRMLDWKHPELVVELAEYLEKEKVRYRINIIGDGPLSETIRKKIEEKHLENTVHMLGSMDAEKVRGYMERASIFVATSDYHEGWGAVINEAMNSGCAVVASSAMGAVPFLIEDGGNGVSYNIHNKAKLFGSVKELLKNKALRENISESAYRTIHDEWNAHQAAKRLIALSQQLLENKNTKNTFKDGPCSRAKIFKKGD